MRTLFDSIQIGNMHCSNRILRSATWEALADERGFMGKDQYKIYETLAQNKVGLISTGYARVMESDCPNAGMMGIYGDQFIPSYQKLTALVHQYDSKIMMQIAYGGTKTTYRVGERQILAPSAIPEISTGTVGTPMTKEDIATVIQAHGEAARRVQQSGFDAVQIHGGHSYLLNQFLSPYYNRRIDEYGGCLENRARLLLNCCDAVRHAVGNDYPILVKITCTDFFDGGFHFNDCRTLCSMLAAHGVNAIEISGNIHGKAETMGGQSFDGQPILKHGYFLRYAEKIAQEQEIPIFVTGGFRDPEEMTAWLNASNITGFGMSRPLLCEPDLVYRWTQGKKDCARCVHCSRCRTPSGNYCTVFDRFAVPSSSIPPVFQLYHGNRGFASFVNRSNC